jgi:UDPglucose 6-dehydrogenase
MLQAGKVPIHEELLPELFARHVGRGLTFSSDIQQAFQFCDVAFICVGTPPSATGDADLSYVEGVASELARSLDGHKVIVEKSTVPVGTCEAVRRTMILNHARQDYFSIASNPEFLREGTAVSDFLFPDRLVFGVDDEISRDALMEIYRPILDGSYYLRPDAIPGKSAGPAKLIVSSVKSAELIKHASNAFLALKISFINAVATVCERVGADVRQVAEGIGSDSRIGPKFLNPGIGYGGSCFPKDVLAFRSVAQEVGYDFALLSEIMAINEGQKARFVAKVREALWTLRGKRLAVLGLAFKGGTDDVRDSPAIDIIRRLKAEGVSICAFDPAAMAKAQALFDPGEISFAADAYSACQGADALLILTEWQDFADLDLERLRDLLKHPIVIDGKNLLSPERVRESGLHYFGIGSGEQTSTWRRVPVHAAPGVAAPLQIVGGQRVA